MAVVTFSFNSDDFKNAYDDVVLFNGMEVSPKSCAEQGIYIPYCECADVSDLFDALTSPVSFAPGILIKGVEKAEDLLKEKLESYHFGKGDIEFLVSLRRKLSKLNEYATCLTQKGREELLRKVKSEDEKLFKLFSGRTNDEIYDYLYREIENVSKTVRKFLREKYDLDEFFYGVITDRPENLLSLADMYGAKGFCITVPPSVLRDMKFSKYNVDEYINGYVTKEIEELRKVKGWVSKEDVERIKKEVEKKFAPLKSDSNVSVARLMFQKKLAEVSYSDDEFSLMCFFPRKKKFYFDKFGRKKVRFVGSNEDLRRAIIKIGLANIHNASEVPYSVIDFKCDGFKCTPENELTRGKKNVCEVFMPLRDNIAKTQVLLKSYVALKKENARKQFEEFMADVKQKASEEGVTPVSYIVSHRLENKRAMFESLYNFYSDLEKSSFYEDGLRVAEDFMKKVCK